MSLLNSIWAMFPLATLALSVQTHLFLCRPVGCSGLVMCCVPQVVFMSLRRTGCRRFWVIVWVIVTSVSQRLHLSRRGILGVGGRPLLRPRFSRNFLFVGLLHRHRPLSGITLSMFLRLAVYTLWMRIATIKHAVSGRGGH